MQPILHPRLGRLDELALEALSANQPVARASDSYVALEIVWDDDSPEDVAVTSRFVRFSAPYERVELDLSSPMTSLRRARPTRFVTTVRAPLPPSATLSFDKMWFEQPETTIVATEDAAIAETPLARANSWLWLGISLLAASIAVGVMQYVL